MNDLERRKALFAAAAELEGDQDISAGASRAHLGSPEGPTAAGLEQSLQEALEIQRELGRTLSNLKRNLQRLKQSSSAKPSKTSKPVKA